MATARARATQRHEATQRLIRAANVLAATLGIAPPVIPTYYRDQAHLPTMQLDAVAAFLESAVAVPNAASEAMAEIASRPDTAAKTPTKPRAPKKAAGA